MADHSSSCTSCRGSQEKISYLLGHIPATLSSYSSACAVGSLSCKVEQMLSSSCYPISGGGDGRKKSLDHDFYPFDCANGEEGAGVSEEPAKPPVPSRSSGSKRSRAAEVHNMSEKRRRSRINEKMRALQNLIPNSNKTDKASMLDEAIEYLKQLQLQVQILSVRNGLNLQSMYLSGSLQPLQSCFHLDSDTAMNIGAGMLPLNQDSAVQSSFNLSNQYTSSHQYTIKSSFINVTNPETLIVKPSESHHGSFQVPIACEEICTGDMSTNMPLAAVPYTRNITENARSATAVDASKQLGRHTSSLICINHLEECMLGNVGSSQEMLDNEENYIQQLPGLEELF